MKRFLLSVALALVPGVSTSFGQSLYTIRKSQVRYETSGSVTGSGFSGTAIAPATGTFVFTAQAPEPATLTLPSGAIQPLSPAVSGSGFALVQGFTTQAALDAAYPDGRYGMTGASGTALSLNLGGDSFSGSAAIVISTNWSNGLLAIPPAPGANLTLPSNSTYATAQPGARVMMRIVGLGDGVNLRHETWSRAVLGFPATPAAFTSFVVPANTLAPGGLYLGELEWDLASTLDTTSVPNGGVIAFYSRILRFYIVGRAPADPAPAAPVITSQPASQVGSLGSSVTFSVGITGESPTVLWFCNGERIDLDGAKYSLGSGGALTVANLSTDDAGRYFAHVLNPGGFVSTIPANLAVSPNPTITRQPYSVTVGQGSTAVLSVGALGATTYQWRLGGSNVAGATGPTLVIENMTAARAGAYTVVVSNSSGTVTSAPATLRIASNASDSGRLINLSILTPLGAGEAMTMGTVVGGAGTSGTKPLLLRAAGPALAPLGVSAFLPDPTMTLTDTAARPAAIVATNDDWSGAATLSNAFVSAGAFAYASPNSKDAAIFQPNLAPGSYTVQVADAGTGAGTVIAELYDATPAAAFTSSTPRLVNVSVLKQITPGSALTAGFVVGGTAARTVLLRAIGPTLALAPFNITTAMSDPQLTLTSTSVNPGVTVATNNDWAGDAAITAVASRVGAFAVANAASKDAMLLLTLAPGSYTAQVSPVSGTSGGMAIVEVYEVP